MITKKKRSDAARRRHELDRALRDQIIQIVVVDLRQNVGPVVDDVHAGVVVVLTRQIPRRQRPEVRQVHARARVHEQLGHFGVAMAARHVERGAPVAPPLRVQHRGRGDGAAVAALDAVVERREHQRRVAHVVDVVGRHARVAEQLQDDAPVALDGEGDEVVAPEVAHAHVGLLLAAEDERDALDLARGDEEHELVALLEAVALLLEALPGELHDAVRLRVLRILLRLPLGAGLARLPAGQGGAR